MKFRKAPGQTSPKLKDVAKFEKALLSGAKRLCDGFAGGSGKVVVVRVPGRLDVMGGIADYCGSVVCEGTLEPAAVLGLQARRDRKIRILSLGLEAEGLAPQFEMSLDAFRRGRNLISYSAVRERFKSEPSTSWAAYVAGALYVLLKEKVAKRFPSGFNIVLQSSVPLGAGIGSSAAIEVATMHALNTRTGLGLEGLELARLCQIVENRVVGAPCGIMDQIVTTLGRQNHLLAIKCQPGEVLKAVQLPEGCAVAGINSGVKHSVGGSRYTNVRIGAFMGHKIILNRLKVDAKHDPFSGYLCRIDPERYREQFARHLPSQMSGRDFLARYGDTVDPITKIDPDTKYRIKSRAEHPIYENARVNQFVTCLALASETGDEGALVEAGELMHGSHWSYRSRCGLDSPETLLLVDLAKAIGVKGGVYGAKITGGGAGGTVAVLGKAESLAHNVRRIAERYETATGISPDVFIGSSPGAQEFGHREYYPVKGG